MALIIDRKRSIGDTAREVDVQEHVIRFWETQFKDYIKPTIGAGNRRYFYDKDIKVLKTIKYYLYEKGYTIKGLNKLLEKETLSADIEKNINMSQNKMEIKLFNNYSEKKKINNMDIVDYLKNFKNKLNNFYEKLRNV